MTLFGRQVQVELGPEGGSGVLLRGLRVSFKVRMDRAARLNNAVIQVYNPAPTTVALLQDRSAVVRLSAGYDVPRLLFQGNPIRDGVEVARQGPDRVLTIEAADGGRAWQLGVVDAVFAGDTTAAEVLEEVARQLEVPRATLRVPDAVRFPRGICLSGSARDVLSRLAQATGGTWRIQDGVLRFESPDDVEETAALFSAAAGTLVGSPRRTERGGVEVTGLLDPAMRPGSSFRVASEVVSGDYVASVVEFEGDSGFDRPFYVHVAGRPR